MCTKQTDIALTFLRHRNDLNISKLELSSLQATTQRNLLYTCEERGVSQRVAVTIFPMRSKLPIYS